MKLKTIKKCFNYNPKTGELFYSMDSPINKGKKITRKYVTLNKEKISCNKVIYAIMKGEIPSFALGFSDRDNKNWKWDNIEPLNKIISKRQKGKTIKSNVGKVSTTAFDRCMDNFLIRGFPLKPTTRYLQSTTYQLSPNN